MGRRRRKVVRIPKRRLPTVFLCPQCGRELVNVTMMKGRSRAIVHCGGCGIKEEFDVLPSRKAVDIYCMFIDKFYASVKASA
ncbi:MAG: hypothetical protein ACE5Z5_00385 [Candidatus Bathyarchaeia archaeon]